MLTAFPSIRHEFFGNNWRAPFVDHGRRETLDRDYPTFSRLLNGKSGRFFRVLRLRLNEFESISI